MGACQMLVRVVLIIFNIIFLLAGLLLLGFGAALKAVPMKLFAFFTKALDGLDLENELDGITNALAIFMIVIGIVIFLIALFGILGAITLKKFFLIPYIIIIILILAAEIALIIVAVVAPGSLEAEMIKDFSTQDSTFTKKVGNYYEATPPNDPVGRFWYTIQNSFACCGFRTDSKFEGAQKEVPVGGETTKLKLEVPSSCCTQNLLVGRLLPMWNDTRVFKDFQKCLTGDEGFVNKEGCLDEFLFNANRIPIIIAGITLAVEVILIVCAIITICLTKNKEYV